MSTVPNPWLALWLRPRAAIDAAVRQKREVSSLVLALALAASAGLAAAPALAGVAGSAVLAALGLALAAALYFVNGWLVNGAAHWLGGRGAAAPTRYAFAWSSGPVILANLFAFAAGERLAAVSLTVSGIANLWSLALLLAMLSRVQAFGRWRALASLILGGALPALVVAVLFRSLVFQPFSTASASMAPTLMPGDLFLVSKWDYGYGRHSFPFDLAPIAGRLFVGAPQRGDVVVFRHNGEDWVKRVVGLPGDKIQLTGARLLVNGRTVERQQIADAFKLPDASGPAYREILPEGVSHLIVQLEDDKGQLSNTALFEVPAGRYFVLGDNRDNSMDSRLSEVGFVDGDELIGRARFIYYSKTGAPRERMGTRVE